MNVLETINSKLQEKKTQISEFVTGGKAIDFANYAALVGEIRGLSYAMNEIKDMNDKLVKEDNE